MAGGDEIARREFAALVEALVKLREEKRAIYRSAKRLGFDVRTLHAATSLAAVVEKAEEANLNYSTTLKQ